MSTLWAKHQTIQYRLIKQVIQNKMARHVMSYPFHWKSNSILMTNQHTKVYCMPFNNYSCFTAPRSILYFPTKRLKVCLESHGMVSQSQIQYVLSVPAFTKQGNLERLKSNLSYFSAKTVWIVQILNQTFDYVPLEVFTCICIALSHSLPLSACMNICMTCACKIDVTADPTSSDFHYLAEIRGKSDL